MLPWSMVDLSGVTLLKETDGPLLALSVTITPQPGELARPPRFSLLGSGLV